MAENSASTSGDVSKSWDDYTAAADNLLALVQARHSAEDWPQLQTQLEGEVQAKLRSALVSLALVELPKNPAMTWIKTDRNLYEYLLIDVGMSGCARISKVKEGLNAVQLYLHRCRERLEPGVSLNIPEVWWEWITNYRIWEANRKIFLYPENYLDPSIRQSKTTLFKDFENSLKQGNLDPETIEKAFQQYLEGFAELAQLVYVDAYYHDVSEEASPGDGPQAVGSNTSIFFFARTKAEPYRYYYIVWQPGDVWSEWNEVGITINATHITPVFVFDRLFLFWVERRTLKDSDEDSTAGTNKKVHVEKATIKYSFYNFNKDWVQPQTLVPETVINVSGAISPTNFDSLFRPGFFDTTRIVWNKVYCLKVLPTAFASVSGESYKAEKLVVLFGPMLNTDELSNWTGANLAPSINTNPYLKELEGWLFRAAQNFKAIKSQIEGNLPAFPPVVLESDLESNFLIQPNEIIFLSKDKPEVNFLRVVKDGPSGPIGLAQTDQVIPDQYNGVESAFPIVYKGKPTGYDLAPTGEFDTACVIDYESAKALNHMVLYRLRKIAILKFDITGQTAPLPTAINFPNYSVDSSAGSVAFDYDGTGKLDHLLLYSAKWLYIYKKGSPGPAFLSASASDFVSQGVPNNGLSNFVQDYLKQNVPYRVFAFDFTGSQLQDHLVIYGAGKINIVTHTPVTNPVFVSKYSNAVGFGDFDLKSDADRAFAFDYESTGHPDHLVFYRPGTGKVVIVKHAAGVAEFTQVFSSSGGIVDFEFKDPNDRAFAFDYEGTGKLDHLVLYRPGTGKIAIVKHPPGTTEFTSVYSSLGGIGDYDLKDKADRIFAFDYEGTGKLDHLVLHRPGTGVMWILRNNHQLWLSQGNRQKTVFTIANHPTAFVYQSDKESFLMLDRINLTPSITRMVTLVNQDSNLTTPLAVGQANHGPPRDSYNFQATRLSTAAVHRLSSALFAGGIDKLLGLPSQQIPVESLLSYTRFQFNSQHVIAPDVQDGAEVDFDGAYGPYYWELFFHAPILIFSVLNGNQTYDQAEKWLKYIFNPTAPEVELGAGSFVTSTLGLTDSQKIYNALMVSIKVNGNAFLANHRRRPGRRNRQSRDGPDPVPQRHQTSANECGAERGTNHFHPQRLVELSGEFKYGFTLLAVPTVP